MAILFFIGFRPWSAVLSHQKTKSALWLPDPSLAMLLDALSCTRMWISTQVYRIRHIVEAEEENKAKRGAPHSKHRWHDDDSSLQPTAVCAGANTRYRGDDGGRKR